MQSSLVQASPGSEILAKNWGKGIFGKWSFLGIIVADKRPVQILGPG